jgi:hypothetical protein
MQLHAAMDFARSSVGRGADTVAVDRDPGLAPGLSKSKGGATAGVLGLQDMGSVTLVRHAYARTETLVASVTLNLVVVDLEDLVETQKFRVRPEAAALLASAVGVSSPRFPKFTPQAASGAGDGAVCARSR